MNVILHIGAHRCATTSFQHYLRHNRRRLAQEALGFWGPRRTRNGLFSGVLPGPVMLGARDPARRAAGRIRLACARSQLAGQDTVIVSDENILGSVRENIRLGTLYASAGERVARYVEAFDGAVSAIVLNIRSQDHYWSSALAYAEGRGIGPVPAGRLRTIAGSRRGWRDVIGDIAGAAARVPLQVFPFEAYCGQPETQLAQMTGIAPPTAESRAWLNRSACSADRGRTIYLGGHASGGRWIPFSRSQAQALREAYADDILWLAAGAGGIARLMENNAKLRTGETGPGRNMTRGRPDDRQDRRVAQAR